MWTLMYRGGFLVGALAALAFVLWRIVAAVRERARLEALVASRTRQLRQSEELFRSIFEHATEGIYQSSLDGHNLRANPEMARICGYANPEQMQRELGDVATQFYVRPERRQEINADMARDGGVVQAESEIRRRDGSAIWIAESVRTVVEPASGETVYQGSIVDVTARREVQAAREAARVAAETANAAKTRFLARMTHELRTPLTGILSNARVALRDPVLDEKNRARYALIADSGEHLLALIDEALDLSSIEAGRVELHFGCFSLVEMVYALNDDFRARALEKRLEFRCILDPFLQSMVHGDALRLRQVLYNLLGNAFKFTSQGVITLSVSRIIKPGYDTAAVICFEVADTGIGISDDQFAVIFEPFQQATHCGVTTKGGVGLGLHIGARLVELMGGQLRVESILGQGSRFFFDLPLLAEPLDEEPLPTEGHSRPPLTLSAPLLNAASSMVPPTSEIGALLTYTLEGDVVRLRARLREIVADNTAFADFVREVDAMATGFRLDDIGDYLGQLQSSQNDEPLQNKP